MKIIRKVGRMIKNLFVGIFRGIASIFKAIIKGFDGFDLFD